jgi:glycosyl transferase, family 25
MQGLKVYVINLDGADERMCSVAVALDALDMRFERVPAVDGRKFDVASIAEYDAVRARYYVGREMVGAEIGCFYSHLNAARVFLESGADYALVLEDDVRPLCNVEHLLEKVIPDLNRHDPDWLMLNAGSPQRKITTDLKRYSASGMEFTLASAHYFPMTAWALVWSRKGAAQFVESHGAIFAPVDNYFRYWLTRTGHGYSLSPPPVSVSDLDSYIYSASGGQRKDHGRAWNYGFAKQRRLFSEKIIAWRNKWSILPTSR